ncbi:PAS domain-containing protein [Pontibacter harenae]|uniref:PAS domain-containing protein n=1 Tax=Pontibacter harenae TaxID=2894083 RepID=UPI001E4A66D6|nr:PAS domain-containing protein [Pontibacter harenae]MCC9166777.1 PAS domain-containing protein [Pontibacter harenae]
MKFKKSSLFAATSSNQTIRYITIAFSILLVALLSVSIFSFISARNVQDNYNSLVSDDLKKLELIHAVGHHEDAIQHTSQAHVSTTDALLKHRYEQEIERRIQLSQTTLEQLRPQIEEGNQQILLQRFVRERKQYYRHLRNLIAYSRQGRQQKAASFNDSTFTPAYDVHQTLISNLGKSIQESMHKSGKDAVDAVSYAVKVYNALLVLILVLALAAGLFIRRIFKQLKRDNLVLQMEIQERQQLSKALSESQREYKMLFDTNPLPIWVYDQQTLKFLEVNQAAIKEYGYTRDEFLETTLDAISPVEEVSVLRHRNGTSDKGVDGSGRIRHRRKDGSTLTVEVRSHALPENEGLHPRLEAALNVDDQVRMLEMLKRNEQQLREISSSIPGAVYQFYRDQNGKQAYIFLSEGIKSLYGLNPEEAYQNSDVISNHIHPEDLAYVEATIQHSYQELTPWEVEYRFWNSVLHKWIWIRGHGLPTLKENKVIVWNGTLIDITKQKEAQSQLMNSEANLRALLNSSPQAIYLLDKDLKIVSFNSVAASDVKQFLLKDLVVGESIMHFLDGEMIKSTLQNHTNALEGKTTIYETGQGEFWHEVAFRPVFGNNGDVLAVSLSIHDISEQKQALEIIKRSQLQLARAQQLANLGNWEYDLMRDILTWSDGVYSIYGVDKESFRPTFLSKAAFAHPQDRNAVIQAFEDTVKQQSLMQLEYRIVCTDNSIRNIYEVAEIVCDDTGKAVKLSGSVQDITDRKQAERDVTEAKNLLQTTLENIPEIVFSTNAEGSITYISPQCFELTGYKEEDFLGDGQLWLKIIHQKDHKIIEKQVKPNLKLGRRQSFAVRIVNKHNEAKWMQLRISPVLDEHGRFVRSDGSAADITHNKKIEAKRNELTDELLRQNKNLQQFAYIVSHNLRAPIANILGLTSIYDRQNGNEMMNSKVIDNLATSAELLDSTIKDLNDILTVRSEINKVQEEVHFKQVLEHIATSVRTDVSLEEIYLNSDFNAAPSVVTIRSYVQSIMQNLITNAVKYRSPDRKLQLQLKTFTLPNYICLTVSDNGLGIDLAREKEKVFGLYKRFHPNIEGKGLGLHLVKTQAELLGGRVEVESQVGVGTTFSIFFKN